MKFKPLRDRILVKRWQAETKSAGGIIIPDNAKEKPVEGTVVAIGSGKLLKSGEVRAPEVKPGDRIMFAKYTGSEITLDGVEHVVLREDDLLCVLD